MPLVNVRYNPKRFYEVDNLRIACSELVPAAFHCLEGQLSPGSIEFFALPSESHDSMHCDVFVAVEAYHYEEREHDLDERTKRLHSLLKELFTDITFAVWPKLVTAGWASDVPDLDFDGDMSMGAAFGRAYFLLREIRTTS